MMKKRNFNLVFLAITAAITAFAGCSREQAVSPSDHKSSPAVWLSFRGNKPGNAGIADETVKPPLGLLWKIKLKTEFRSSPAVDSTRIYIGGTDGFVYAFDKITGKPAWKFKAGGAVIAPPVIDGATLYVGSGSNKFYALDTTTGKPIFKPFEAKGVINGAAAVTKDLVIFGSYDGYVYALDKKDITRIVWSHRTGDWINSTPTIAGDFVYIGSDDKSLYKLGLADGVMDWRFQTGGPVYSTPIVADGKIYFTSWDGNAYALDEKGNQIWKTKVDEQVSASLALYKGKLYGGGMFNGPFFALDAAKGTLLHSFKTWGGFDASPVISGNMLYIGSFDDNFYAINADTFAVEWKRPMRASVRAVCAVADGSVFVADMQGRLFAFAPAK